MWIKVQPAKCKINHLLCSVWYWYNLRNIHCGTLKHAMNKLSIDLWGEIRVSMRGSWERMKRKVELLELVYSDELQINDRLLNKEINALFSPSNSYWREKNVGKLNWSKFRAGSSRELGQIGKIQCWNTLLGYIVEGFQNRLKNLQSDITAPHWDIGLNPSPVVFPSPAYLWYIAPESRAEITRCSYSRKQLFRKGGGGKGGCG